MNNSIQTFSYEDLFHHVDKGTYGLTELYVYKSLRFGGKFVPLYGGQQDHTEESQLVSVNARNKKNKKIKIFEGDCLIISLDGSAGSMTYKPLEIDNKKVLFALNHHAGVIRAKNKSIINLRYFKFRYENFLKNLAVSDGSKTLTKETLEKLFFNIPNIKAQEIILKHYEKINQLKKRILAQEEEINAIKIKTLECEFVQKTNDIVPISSILDYVSRNDCLSEEGIYNNIPLLKSKKTVTVLRGSSDNIFYGEINYKTPNIHKLENRQGIHIITRGKAGKLTYLSKGTYATNTNAFLFFIKKEFFEEAKIKNEFEESIYLRFLIIYLQPIYYEASSSSDLSVFPLTELMKNLSIPKFKYCKQMEAIVKKYESIEKYEELFNIVINKIDAIFSKEIVV